jgi:hypothetical protein
VLSRAASGTWDIGGCGERREVMRFKRGLLLTMGLLVVVSSAMAVPVTLYDTRGDGEFQFVEPSSKLHFGIQVDGKTLTSSVKGNNLTIEGIGKGGKEVDITFFDAKGVYHPTYTPFSGLVKELALSYEGDGKKLSAILKGSRKGDDFGSALPTPEPGTFLLLAGTMAVGYGILRKRVRK